MSANRIIGGMFGAETTPGPRQGLSAILPAKARRHDYAAARCGLRAAAMQDGISRVWLPSYLCEAMIDCLDGAGREIAFYPIDQDLQVADRDWMTSLGPHDLVVVIAYFGLRPSPQLIDELAAKRPQTLIDAAACPPTLGADWGGDAVLYSPRKLAGVADGGILVALTGKFAVPATNANADAWNALAQEAFAARTEFDRAGASNDDRRWYALKEKWEHGPAGTWAMSAVTLSLLEDGLPWTEIAARRRRNHETLAARLGPGGLLSLAQGSQCPLGYVVRFPDEAARNAVRAALIKERIYPPIHWLSPHGVPARFAASRDLASRVLTLPCDQRYSEAEMERMADIVLTTFPTRRGP